MNHENIVKEISSFWQSEKLWQSEGKVTFLNGIPLGNTNQIF